MQSDDEHTYESFEDLRRRLLPSPAVPVPSPARATATASRTDNLFTLNNNNDVDDDTATATATATATTHWYQNPHQITAMISNFSTSYNVVNISLVLPILKELHSGSSDKDTAAVASSLLAGMIFGQLVGGALGDSWLGRMGALRLVMALQIVASLACAVLGIGSKFLSHGEDIFLWLAAWRFVLGIGCGGVYPLAAVISAEEGKEQSAATDSSDNTNTNTNTNNNQERKTTDDPSSIQRVVLTFSMQGFGFVSVPLVAVLLLYCTSDLNFVWRAMLGIGAFPGIVLMGMQCCHHRRAGRNLPFPEVEQQDEEGASDGELENDSVLTSFYTTTIDDDSERITMLDATENEQINNDERISHPDHGSGSNDHGGWVQTLLHEPGLGRKVLGTAGTWFLFDIVFYGNTIFQPIVVEAAFGNKSGSSGIEMLRKTAIDSFILSSIALPGYAMAGIVMGKKTCCVTQTPRYVMLQGFAAMTVLYATIGFNWTYLRGDPTMLVFLYGMTFFFANYGPNTTTFILPSLIFEEEHRATWNGVSAAAGKLGALTGATLFAPAADILGDHVVMLICAGVALFGYILTYCAVPKQQQQQEPEQSSATTDDEDDTADNADAALNASSTSEVV